jgi:hypothetical protein
MKYRAYIRSFFATYSLGSWAIASLLACCATGIILAIPYDVNDPYHSLRLFLLTSPYAVLFRNIHYWSAQAFVILTILHTWEYLKNRGNIKSAGGRWLRLCIALLVCFVVMLTGFILKGDADSEQARRILDTLIRKIPLAGKWISFSLLGTGKNYQIIYVHHIATGTLFLFFVLFEHARTIWGQWKPFIFSALSLVGFGYFFQAPLHDGINPVVKGPWYFIGLQEIVRWMSRPGWSLVIILLVLVLIYYIPVIHNQWYNRSKYLLLGSFYLYLGVTLIAYFFRGENGSWIWPWEKGYAASVYFPFRPQPIPFSAAYKEQETAFINGTGKTESCLLCHAGMTGFSPSHDPSAIGCIACHGGNPSLKGKKQAHRGMILVPGNLSDARQSCGANGCHPGIPERVMNSLMSTMSGVVSVDRFVFHEQPSPSLLSHIRDIGHSPADQHLRNLCANCHLGNEKTLPSPANQISRGGGCTACHIHYDKKAWGEFCNYRKDKSSFPEGPQYHPSLSISITDDHCFGCHSRSGRIALSYTGMLETLLEAGEMPDTTNYHLLADERVVQQLQPDVHHQLGLECIDCHTSVELMGDGNSYLHKEDQTRIRCGDCHFRNRPTGITTRELDPEQQKIYFLRYPHRNDTTVLRGAVSGEPMIHMKNDRDGRVLFMGKNSCQPYFVKPPAVICSNGSSHRRLDCITCHAGWAPRCIGCHNTYDRNAQGFDMLTNREMQGSWVEHVGKFMSLPPTLGVLLPGQDTAGVIRPAVPGMILSIDPSGFIPGQGKIPLFARLYAPIEPHTTMARGRSCRSCHLDPVSLGYGEGKLEYIISGNSGHWAFTPRYRSRDEDHLPEDAWIGFLQPASNQASTRLNFRPFTPEEQKRILLVGSCLQCHAEESMVMKSSLDQFNLLLRKRSEKCALPVW